MNDKMMDDFIRASFAAKHPGQAAVSQGQAAAPAGQGQAMPPGHAGAGTGAPPPQETTFDDFIRKLFWQKGGA
jgi:hypothetical protein